MAQKINSKQNGGFWEEIGRASLTIAGDTISIASLPARKYLCIELSLLHNGGNITTNLRFNSDSAANYAYIRDSGSSVSQTSFGTGNSTMNQFSILSLVNAANQEKQITMITNFNVNGAASVSARDTTVGKWANTSAQISRIDVFNGGAGDYAIGSEIIVLGHD